MRRTIVAVAVVAAACASPRPRLAEDEVAADRLWLPQGAWAGMYATWRYEGDSRLAEETLACVAEAPDSVTIEERRTLRDGTTEVTAVRFARDGRPLAAWRGAPGGAGRPLRVVPGRSLEEMRAEADRQARRAGLPAHDVKVTQATARESVTTPAGTFECARTTLAASILFLESRHTWWHATAPLPLTRLVKLEEEGVVDYRMQLVAYGRTGARPTLRLPPRDRTRPGG